MRPYIVDKQTNIKMGVKDIQNDPEYHLTIQNYTD